MNKADQELSDLIQACLDGRATDEQVAQLNAILRSDAAARDVYLQMADVHSCLAVDESLWVDDIMEARASEPQRSQGRERWLNWRPIAAAAAGIVFGMLCTSMVFGYTQPRSPAEVSKVLALADPGFESGSQVPAHGIPSRAGVWSGDFSSVVATENGIKPREGQRMLRLLRSDNERSSKNERSYVGSAAQVIDLRPLRAELSGADQLVEVSAQFDSIPTPSETKYEFNVKAAAFRGEIADAPRVWGDHEASVSRSDCTVIADSDVATWQRVVVPLMVPPDADFLVIECAVVFKGPQAEHSVAEFPGHYVDQVEARLSRSSTAN